MRGDDRPACAAALVARPPRGAGLKAFAASLGLSPTTVSRALDGYGDVASETRARVVAAARLAGYHPDGAARRLRRGRPQAVAVVLPADRGRIGPAVFLEMLGRTALALAEQGLDLLVVPTVDAAAEEAALRRLIDGRHADAFILLRTRLEDPRVALLESRGVPFVCHGRTARAECHPYIDGDGEGGFRAATLDLARRGHRRIAHIAAPQELTFAALRRAGWRAGLAAADLPPGGEAIAPPTEAGGFAAARSLLAASCRPSALLCATDAIAIGAMQAIRGAGLRPGRDIAVIGHDNLAAGAFLDPALSSMEIAADDVGGELAALLLARLGDAPLHTLQRVLPLRQIQRATTCPATGTSA